MEKAKKLLGINLRRLREARGLTQSELAEKTDLSTKMIQKLEYGQTNPSLETLDALASALKCSASDLYLSARESFTQAMAKQSLSDSSLLESARILEALAKTGPVTRAGVLYLLFEERKYFEALPPQLRQAVSLLRKVE